ncbi:MAG: hypothetical protein Q4P06_08980 [Actinomycetaceae bacterium]|nr:hypothetical protein [Actinomycetaceae bacterium]
MSKRNLVIALTVLVAIAVSITAWGLLRHREDTEPVAKAGASPAATNSPSAAASPAPTESETSKPSSEPVPLTTLPAEEIQRAVQTIEKAPEEPEKAVAPQALELYGVDLSEVFPPGTKITVDQDSWTDVDETTALVATTITRPGEEPQTYTAVLGKSEGEWKLLGTLPLETETP